MGIVRKPNVRLKRWFMSERFLLFNLGMREDMYPSNTTVRGDGGNLKTKGGEVRKITNVNLIARELLQEQCLEKKISGL